MVTHLVDQAQVPTWRFGPKHLEYGRLQMYRNVFSFFFYKGLVPISTGQRVHPGSVAKDEVGALDADLKGSAFGLSFHSWLWIRESECGSFWMSVKLAVRQTGAGQTVWLIVPASQWAHTVRTARNALVHPAGGCSSVLTAWFAVYSSYFRHTFACLLLHLTYRERCIRTSSGLAYSTLAIPWEIFCIQMTLFPPVLLASL